MFPECHASFAALLQAGIFSRPLSLPLTLSLGQLRAELALTRGEPTARSGMSCQHPRQHPDTQGDHPLFRQVSPFSTKLCAPAWALQVASPKSAPVGMWQQPNPGAAHLAEAHHFGTRANR